MDFGDDFDPQSIKNRAKLHEQHRHRVVATILADLHLMAVADVLPKVCFISAQKAFWQDSKGSEARGTEAAHCVPCQIKITGRRPEQYIRKYSTDRADKIEAYFGKTDDFLPAVFNKCDSQAERLGLIAAFWDACVDVINSGFISQSFRQPTVSIYIKNAFSIYKSGAQNAFNFTIRHFENNRNFYATYDPQRAREEDQKIKIIRYYSTELNSSGAISDITRFGELREMIELYKGFK